MKILRVFPRRIRNATPDDIDVRIGEPGFFEEAADRIDISVTFTWDLPVAERLVNLWAPFGPVHIGGPATGAQGGEFVPGQYLKNGITITSRGCPNKCWFCLAWRRDGVVRELPIRDGWIIQDDNLLACSESHLRDVFAMLKRQPERPVFSGGLEACRITPWIAAELKSLRPEQLFVAYDLPGDLEAVVAAGDTLRAAGFTRHDLRCYVLTGWKGDTTEKAEARMIQAWNAGFIPSAMVLLRDDGTPPTGWSRFIRQWQRPAIIAARMKAQCITNLSDMHCRL